METRRVDESTEPAFCIDARHSRLHCAFLSALEHDAGDRTIFDANLLDLRVRANFRTRFLGGFGKHAREGAKAAARKRRGTNGMSIGCRSEKKDRSRPGGPRAQNIAEDSARRTYRAQQLRLKKLGDKIRNRHGRPSEKIEDAFFA